jgi:diaminopimelate decarboxylase
MGSANVASMKHEHSRLAALAEAYGDAFYLMDVPRYRRNIRAFLSAFRAYYPRTSLAHSYKTNYIPDLCRAAYEEGGYAEVVSGMEFDLALQLGAQPARIILNGPLKPHRLLERALLAGSVVNVDSVQEAESIAQLARQNPGHEMQVGIRLNFALPTLARSRFGVDAESDDLRRVVRLLRDEPNCRLRGIHCHFGGDRTDASYRFRTRRMIELAAEIFAGSRPEFVDIGGGFAGCIPEALKAQMPYAVPDYAEYAEAVAGEFAKALGTSGGPELILEPGIGVLSDVLEFVCTVAVTKQAGGQFHAITTGSIYNIKPTLHKLDLPTQAVPRERNAGDPVRAWRVSGYTCMEIDVMHNGFAAALSPGDFLVFGNVGAYTVVLKPPFIAPAPAVLSLLEDSSVRVAKRAETLDDVLKTYGI